jgi:hypothetical protein
MNARRVAMLYSKRPRSQAHPFEREDGGKVVVKVSGVLPGGRISPEIPAYTPIRVMQSAIFR